MSEQFSDVVNNVMALAEAEAVRLGQHIRTEHILIGLTTDRSSRSTLENLGLDMWTLRREIEAAADTTPDPAVTDRPPQTPEVKKVIEFATKECRVMKDGDVYAEHLLLGLLRERDGVAGQVLRGLGVEAGDVRKNLLWLRPFLRLTTEERAGEISSHEPPHTDPAARSLQALVAMLKARKYIAVEERRYEFAAAYRDLEKEAKRLPDELVAVLNDDPPPNPAP